MNETLILFKIVLWYSREFSIGQGTTDSFVDIVQNCVVRFLLTSATSNPPIEIIFNFRKQETLNKACCWLVGWVLWYINIRRLFNAKSINKACSDKNSMCNYCTIQYFNKNC